MGEKVGGMMWSDIFYWTGALVWSLVGGAIGFVLSVLTWRIPHAFDYRRKFIASNLAALAGRKLTIKDHVELWWFCYRTTAYHMDKMLLSGGLTVQPKLYHFRDFGITPHLRVGRLRAQSTRRAQSTLFCTRMQLRKKAASRLYYEQEYLTWVNLFVPSAGVSEGQTKCPLPVLLANLRAARIAPTE